MEHLRDINKNWFYKEYHDKLTTRFWTFNTALNLLLQRGGKYIVETGSIRQMDDWPGGYSTYIFAMFADRYDLRFDSIEIKKENIAIAREAVGDYHPAVNFHLGDSIKVLEKWKQPIDLLYLDSKDCSPKDIGISRLAQEHQLKELKKAYTRLTDNGIVLLDDNWFENGGKTRWAKKFLIDQNWLNIIDYEQSLWIRR